MSEIEPSASSKTQLRELARLFFGLGVVGFGGPAAHIAMMEEEVVLKRRWLTPEEFLDLVGATNLIPGPNSTEMTMHIGFARAGWAGLFVAGVSFIVPAAGMTLLLAWLYVESSTIPEVEPLLQGVPAAVLALIFGALWRLGKKAIPSVPLAFIAGAVALLLLLGIREIPALAIGTGVGGALLYMFWRRDGPNGSIRGMGWPVILIMGLQAAVSATPSLAVLGLFFLKVGAVLYGSGYVLIAFLEAGIVEEYGWLTQTQLLDAIALGQLTPGPILTTSTAVGYMVRGVPGALVATVGIFLPAFLFTGLLHPLVPRLRGHPLTASLLDAVNASSVALMAVVTAILAIGTLTSPGQWGVALIALGLVWSGKTNVVALVLFGAMAGWLLHVVGG